MLNSELFKMINYAGSRGIITELTTNGTLIRENIDRIFESGLSEIAIGVYNRDVFLKILPQVEELIRARRDRGSVRPKTYLDITVYRKSLGQIPDLVCLASKAGFDAVILHRLFNVYGIDAHIEYISNQEEYMLFAEMRRLTHELGLELHLPPRHSRPCYVVKHSIFVDAEGRVTPCCFLPECYIGNTSNLPLDKIIRSMEYNTFVKGMKENPVCDKCRW